MSDTVNPIVKLQKLDSKQKENSQKMGSTSQNQSTKTNSKTTQPPASKPTSSNSKTGQNDIITKLCAIHETTTNTNDALSSYMASNDTRVDKVEKELGTNSKQLIYLSKKVSSMERAANLCIEATEKSKQQQLQSNITIMNIPPIENESTTDLVMQIGAFFNVSVTAADVVSSYRVAHSKNNLLIAKLKSQALKIEIMTAAKETKLMASNIIECSGETDQQLYINHHVTPYFGKLPAFGRAAVKDNKLNSCWISSNGLMAKINQDDSPHAFMSINALSAFINKQ